MATPARYALRVVPVRIWWRRGCLERFVTEQPPYSILVRGIEEDVLPTTQHDTVLIGSPIWNVRTPMIMSTFAQSHDCTGKRVLPFVTYAVSGLGRAQRTTPPPARAPRSKPDCPFGVKKCATTAPTSRPGFVTPVCLPADQRLERNVCPG
jgi:hypothetical protein